MFTAMIHQWHPLGESNPSFQDENLTSYPIDEGGTTSERHKIYSRAAASNGFIAAIEIDSRAR